MEFPEESKLVNDWPTRDQVQTVWVDLAEGALSRADVRRWAARWVEGVPSPAPDGAVRSALQRLHGYNLWSQDDIRRESVDPFQSSLADIKVEFLDWKLSCDLETNDPLMWKLDQIERTAEGKRRFLEDGD